MSKWINIPHIEGLSSRQAHTNLPKDTYEREIGKQGFNGPSSHMYHPHPPTSWDNINGPLSHHAFDTTRLPNSLSMLWETPALLKNKHLELRFWQCANTMDYLLKNADGDELLFIHAGEGDLYCDYGHLQINTGDYIIIPKGTLWRFTVEKTLSILLIEATQQSYQLPEKSIVGQHAIFDSAILDIPKINSKFKQQQGDFNWKIYIKRLNEITIMDYPYNPLDAVGWHGTLMPVRLNWKDIRPLMSHAYHLPPSAHTTFTTTNFVISTFVPRPLESAENILRVPFYHSNDDYDEIIFYHRGEFFSRDNIKAGMMTLHPAGLPHGPHPKSYQQGKDYKRTNIDDVAVMIDSRYPVDITETAKSIENKNYVNSWKI